MAARSVRVSYIMDNDKKSTKTFSDVREDATVEQLVDFVNNSVPLMNATGQTGASLVTSEVIV